MRAASPEPVFEGMRKKFLIFCPVEPLTFWLLLSAAPEKLREVLCGMLALRLEATAVIAGQGQVSKRDSYTLRCWRRGRRERVTG